jgi:hypothetical protein
MFHAYETKDFVYDAEASHCGETPRLPPSVYGDTAPQVDELDEPIVSIGGRSPRSTARMHSAGRNE